MDIYKIKLVESSYPAALDIWEASVIETHDFLKENDRLALKTEIPTYFKYVDAYLWYDKNELIGFSGTNDNNLEMLFIHPKYFRKGYGTKILQYLIQEEDIRFVDVNKDNTDALNFYIKNGFKKYKESETDGQGRAYPIIHLKL